MADMKNTNNKYDIEAIRASRTPEQRAADKASWDHIMSKYGDAMRALAGQEVTFENGVTVNKSEDN